MAQPERFEILVLGSGAGGKLLAWHMARSGRWTAVMERRWIGGSCPNINCLPSKNEIWSAKVAHLVHHAAQFGTRIGPVATDMATVRQRKRDMVDRQIAAHLQNYKTSGTELIMGSGRFVAPKTFEVRLNDGGTRVLAGDQVFLNVGTHATIPSVPGLEATRPLTNIEALELDYLPSHLIVLGDGYVGLELAQAYRRFGSRVTVIEHGPQLMGREDPDVADEVQRILSDEGIQVLVAAETRHVHGRSGEEVSLVVRTASGEQEIEGSDILVAVGRTPNTAGIGLEEAGVELDARGYIRVNERLETSASAVWAIGECAGSPQFTHVSEDDFRIIRDNLAGGKRSTRDRLVPYCMFTDPPLARVGLSEGEAQRQGVTACVARLSMSAVLRTQTTDEGQGFEQGEWTSVAHQDSSQRASQATQERQMPRFPTGTSSPAKVRTIPHDASVDGHSLLNALRCHWPEYVMEGAELGLFMISACAFVVLLEYPMSPVHQALPDPALRRVLIGIAMGMTAIGIIYSPLGQRSGAHFNPAVTLTFFRLGKVEFWDAAFYGAAQFIGGLLGVGLSALVLGELVAHPSVRYAVTVPGMSGVGVAFLAEAVISFLQMSLVLHLSNAPRLARFTGLFAGAMVATYISLEAPYSGMSMNPARTFASALPAQIWTALWVYFTAPPLGMLLAAELYVRQHGIHHVFCAKLHHHNNKRCIFHCNWKQLSVASGQLSVSDA